MTKSALAKKRTSEKKKLSPKMWQKSHMSTGAYIVGAFIHFQKTRTFLTTIMVVKNGPTTEKNENHKKV